MKSPSLRSQARIGSNDAVDGDLAVAIAPAWAFHTPLRSQAQGTVLVAKVMARSTWWKGIE